jgi:DnaK suppressor protein
MAIPVAPPPPASIPIPAAQPGNGGFGGVLQAKKVEIMKSLGMQFENLSSVGRVAEEDQAGVTHEEFVNLRLNRLDWQRLKQVEEALDRLKAGDYGTCQHCEEPIPEKRLKAIPWARYCVPCQEKLADSESHDDHTPVSASVW